jgi:predicted secreted protein
VEELRTACKTPGSDAWRHVALAMAHATTAQAQVNAALEIEAIAEREAAE